MISHRVYPSTRLPKLSLHSLPLLSPLSTPELKMSPPPDETTSLLRARPPAHTYGYTLMFLSALCSAVLSTLFHIATTEQHLPTHTALLLLSATLVFLSLLHLTVHPPTPSTTPPPSANLIILARGCLGGLGAVCYFSSLRYIPVGNSVTLFYTSPAITTLFAACFLRERITAFHLLSLTACTAGIYLIANPDLLSTTHLHSPNILLGSLLALTAAVIVSITSIIVRHMRASIHYMHYVTSYAIFLFLFTAATATPAHLAALHTHPHAVAIVLAASVSEFVQISLLNLGLQHCPAGAGTLIRTIAIPVSYVLGLLFVAEIPSWPTAFGIVCIVSGVAGVALISGNQGE